LDTKSESKCEDRVMCFWQWGCKARRMEEQGSLTKVIWKWPSMSSKVGGKAENEL
jgi:hypothetical protein